MNRQQTGRLGEKLARRHLESLGFKIVDSNYRTRWGEIDLVAEKNEELVFVEVRTRRTRSMAYAEVIIIGGLLQYCQVMRMTASGGHSRVLRHAPQGFIRNKPKTALLSSKKRFSSSGLTRALDYAVRRRPCPR